MSNEESVTRSVRTFNVDEEEQKEKEEQERRPNRPIIHMTVHEREFRTVVEDEPPKLKGKPNKHPVFLHHLRQGNLVLVAQDWDYSSPAPQVVTRWDEKYYSVMGYDNRGTKIISVLPLRALLGGGTDEVRYDIYDVQGIVVTDDLLVKLRFKRDENKYHLWKNVDHRSFYVVNSNGFEGGYVSCNREGSIRVCERNIHYLHELQNTFYYLTGRELDVTPLKDDRVQQ